MCHGRSLIDLTWCSANIRLVAGYYVLKLLQTAGLKIELKHGDSLSTHPKIGRVADAQISLLVWKRRHFHPELVSSRVQARVARILPSLRIANPVACTYVSFQLLKLTPWWGLYLDSWRIQLFWPCVMHVG